MVYTNECYTGVRDSRPAFQQMIQDEQEGKCDPIVVRKWDRLMRSRRDAIQYKAMLRSDYGVKLFAVEGVSEDEDKLVELLFEAM